uniref:RanBP2-type domain-containing protein n=1 Tax=Lotharella globosa TaxID=91324 RepID=A0A6V3NQ74_9EUKA
MMWGGRRREKKKSTQEKKVPKSESVVDAGPWECTRCTFLNTSGKATECSVCGTERPKKSPTTQLHTPHFSTHNLKKDKRKKQTPIINTHETKKKKDKRERQRKRKTKNESKKLFTNEE